MGKDKQFLAFAFLSIAIFFIGETSRQNTIKIK